MERERGEDFCTERYAQLASGSDYLAPIEWDSLIENSCGGLAGIDYISHEERSLYKCGYVVGFFSGWTD
jgi:hypothetical protein